MIAGRLFKRRKSATQLYQATCPQCKTSNEKNTKISIMINICGHSICSGCVEYMFWNGPATCPECGILLHKEGFRQQFLEDPNVERELQIRKDVLKIYNRHEEDFPSVNEYNDYLEKIEVLVKDLVNMPNILEANKKLAAIRRQPQDIPDKNKRRLSRNDKELQEIVDMEAKQSKRRRLQIKEDDERKQKQRRTFKNNLLKRLEEGNTDPKRLVAEMAEARKKHRQEQKLSDKPIPKYKWEVCNEFRKIDKNIENLYVYTPQTLETNGFEVPTAEFLDKHGHSQRLRQEQLDQIACGFTYKDCLVRTLQHTFLGL